MTETLFERYKEALRAGHVAVVRRRYEDAAAAYREAIAIAPDRALPRVALGGVHLRMGSPEAALEAYDEALALAPDDDAALLGRAQALVVLRRTAEAAGAYDRLAAVRSDDGRTVDAAEAARRALAIEPTDARRVRHEELVAGLRGGAAPGAADGPAVEAAWPGDEAARATETVAVLDATPEPPEPPGPDPELLVAEMEAAAAQGDRDLAADTALAAARAYRAQGHVAAAVDACLLGVGARPADVDLHLLLADLAVDRGWSGPAGDAYRNLLRLVELDGDAALGARVRAAAAARLPGDPRFVAS